jgi:hypothetical protein
MSGPFKQPMDLKHIESALLFKTNSFDVESFVEACGFTEIKDGKVSRESRITDEQSINESFMKWVQMEPLTFMNDLKG